MRKAITIGMLVGGLALMTVSYFGLAAPWGNDSVRNADPEVPFAAALFVLGVVIAILSAVVYELLPDRRRK